MSAYVVSEREVLDPEGASRYLELAPPSIAAHGGRYLVRGGAPVAAEGQWPVDRRLVVLEFPDLAAAHRWYDSAEYAEARAIAETALDRRLVFVDGVAS